MAGLKNSYFPQPTVGPNQAHFSKAPQAEINRSTFNRSHGCKTTFDGGYLVPVYIDEVLPGDTFDMSATTFARLATPVKPIMDNLTMDIHFWWIPNRLVWNEWERFMGEQNSPSDDITGITMPNFTCDPANWNQTVPLWPYFGLPQRTPSATYKIQALPGRAYRLIWNEWYRDQNLQDPVSINFDSGSDDSFNANTYSLLRRGKRHDYFTSCLPFRQKGQPVSIPLGTVAPVTGIGIHNAASGAFQSTNVKVYPGQTIPSFQGWGTNTPNTVLVQEDPNNTGFPNIFADLTNATAVTVSDLRTAFQIQKLLERDARGGTRYIELVLSHFGVSSDDLRAIRPLFLGGGSSKVSINPVANTSGIQVSGSPGNVQGELSAYGTAVNRGGFSKSFTEHGFIIGLASVRADLTYQQGTERFWWRETRYDHYWPALAHLSEQAVLNREIWTNGDANDEQVFGYQEAWAEYRYKPSRITGKFNSNASGTLHNWHLSQDFSALPALNQDFIFDQPPIDRVIAVQNEPHFLCDIWFDLKCTRPMPVYSVPGLIDHF